MRHKKLKLGALLLLGLGLTGLQAQTMYVKENSGTQTAYALSNIKKMNFSSGNITVSTTTGNPVTYSLSGIRYLNFVDLGSIPLADKPNETFQIYPNHVIDLLNIKLSDMRNQSGVIEILSMEGKVVYSQAINSNTNVYQINVTSLLQGIYLCKINNGIRIETIKFYKQ